MGSKDRRSLQPRSILTLKLAYDRFPPVHCFSTPDGPNRKIVLKKSKLIRHEIQEKKKDCQPQQSTFARMFCGLGSISWIPKISADRGEQGKPCKQWFNEQPTSLWPQESGVEIWRLEDHPDILRVPRVVPNQPSDLSPQDFRSKLKPVRRDPWKAGSSFRYTTATAAKLWCR